MKNNNKMSTVENDRFGDIGAEFHHFPMSVGKNT